MPEMIRDGAGQGYLAQVNSDNQLTVAAAVVTEEHYVNYKDGNAYNILWDLSITSGSDVCTLYLKNTGTRNIILEGFNAQVSQNISVYSKFNVLGTPANTTVMDVGNLNSGSNNVLTATSLQGDGITGLSGGSLIWKSKVAGGNQSGFVNFDADLVLAPQGTLAVYATAIANWTSIGFFVCWIDRLGG